MASKQKSKSKPKSKSKGQSTNITSKFCIGDVVSLKVKRGYKERSNMKTTEELARIRWLGKTPLGRDFFFGVEFLQYKIGAHKVNRQKVLDGSVGNGKQPSLFKSSKKGYGTFISRKELEGAASLKWNKAKSDSYLKLKKFNEQKLVEACKYGSSRVVKHFLTSPGVEELSEAKLQNAFYYAVAYNHPYVAQTFLEHHYGSSAQLDQAEKKTDDEKQESKHEGGKAVFFSPTALHKLILNRQTRMFALVVSMDAWPLIDHGTAYHKSNEAIYNVFAQKGNLLFIKNLMGKVLQFKDAETVHKYLHFPLLAHRQDWNSTIIHAAMKNNRWSYLQYLLIDGACKEYIKAEAACIADPECKESDDVKQMRPSSLLLTLIMSIKDNTSESFEKLEKYSRVLLRMGANINWFPRLSLQQQLMAVHKTDGSRRFDAKGFLQRLQRVVADDTKFESVKKSYLCYYDIQRTFEEYRKKSWENKNHFICGSILSAFIYQCSELLESSQHVQRLEGIIQNVVTMFIAYGAILHHNDGSDALKYDEWTQFNAHRDTHPKNLYVYNNRYNKMKIYWLPQNVRSESDSHGLESCLRNVFAFGIAEHKRRLKQLFLTMDMDDGLRFAFSEVLPDYLCWDLEFVDEIAGSLPSAQVTPRRTYSYSSSYWSGPSYS